MGLTTCFFKFFTVQGNGSLQDLLVLFSLLHASDLLFKLCLDIFGLELLGSQLLVQRFGLLSLDSQGSADASELILLTTVDNSTFFHFALKFLDQTSHLALRFFVCVDTLLSRLHLLPQA